MNNGIRAVVITGCPGGGKTSLLADLQADAEWGRRVVVLPEAIHAAMRSSVSPHEAVFQRLVVNLQKHIEQAAVDTFADKGPVLLTHRGTLDPLAFCLANGWTEERFRQTAGLRLEDEYQRYHWVIHMVSTAVGTPQFYR